MAKNLNLISDELKFKKKFKRELDWYVIFNVMVIVSIISVAGFSYIFSQYLETSLTDRKKQIASILNSRVNTIQKSFIRSKISVLNDRYTLYKEVKRQDVDFNSLYKDINAIYPSMRINKIDYRPSEQFIDAQVTINDAGNNMSSFMKSVNNSKFASTGIKIEKISFIYQGSGNTVTGGTFTSTANVTLIINNPNIITVNY